jgi:hypothetical protein
VAQKLIRVSPNINSHPQQGGKSSMNNRLGAGEMLMDFGIAMNSGRLQPCASMRVFVSWFRERPLNGTSYTVRVPMSAGK